VNSRERPDICLAGDIGGTKTNLAIFASDMGLVPQAEGTFKSAEYPSLEAIVAEFLSALPVLQGTLCTTLGRAASLRLRTGQTEAVAVTASEAVLPVPALGAGRRPGSEAERADTGVAPLQASVPGAIDRAVFGVAGPVVDGQSTATNLPWVLGEAALQEALGLRKVKLLNDLEATAYGVPHLAPADLFTLNDASPRSGTKAVIAPGTGLGEAILLYHDGKYQVIPSEGGHTDFGPTNLFELRLLRYMMGKYGHVSYERICSGKGIPNIYAYLKKQGFAEELPGMARALRKAEDPTPIIVEKAMAGECELSIAALNAFVSILGAEAGNLALKVMATGGIYLGGGIPPKILSKLKDGTFMAAFVNKGRFAEMLAQIPVAVILNDRTALLGAASYGLGLQTRSVAIPGA
jgi:glucokinase